MKRLRHIRACTWRRIQGHRHDKGAVARHHMAALIGKIPLKPEIALTSRCSGSGDNGNKERAVADLTPDLLIPNIPAPQLALIEKHPNAGRTQCLANALSWLCILRGVAQKYRPARVGHGALITRCSPSEFALGVVGHSRSLHHRPGSLPQAVNGRFPAAIRLLERLKLAELRRSPMDTGSKVRYFFTVSNQLLH